MLRQRLTSGELRRGGLPGRSVVQLLVLVVIVFLVLDRLGGAGSVVGSLMHAHRLTQKIKRKCASVSVCCSSH